MSDIFAPIISACVATACALGGISTYLNAADLRREMESDGFYHSVEKLSHPVSKDLHVEE